ncbi:MAG: competence/damage-inducible protein A [Micavibrio aeruginosavorus]|uniref:Competence/damage-inducible protein A n=1 Tax=Micavibrio aeruginosavorus TaxID=349221 RepID=A0A2W5MWF8_9BACT|nr:MAG: competence/damage-inducible protein A [Micavibrio aeruginosavorus]
MLNKDTYSVALIIVGNEILSGRTQDTNTSWIAENLNAMGIVLHQVRVVPDAESEIIAAIHELQDKVDYIFTTGGIGPTHDDITAESVAKAFKVPLELNPEAYDMLKRHYGSEKEINDARRKMAMIPQGAELILNPVSGAPGFHIGNVFVLAGVPRIMQAMFDDVQTRLKRGKPVLSNTIACSLAESRVAEPLEALQNNYATVAIGSYPHFRGGILGLSLVLRSTDDEALDKATRELIKIIADLGGEPNALSIQSSGKIVTG